jgi:hypothetical protein
MRLLCEFVIGASSRKTLCPLLRGVKQESSVPVQLEMEKAFSR